MDIEYDGEPGLEKALNNDFDLIILDLMLPNINGLEICRRVRQVQSTPIIIITAKSDTYDKVTGLDYGADDYIVKPFEIEELLQEFVLYYVVSLIRILSILMVSE